MAVSLKIGFIGAGKMATALALGFVRAGLTTPKNLIASDPHEVARQTFAEGIGAKTTAANAEVIAFASIIILATKPDQIVTALAEADGNITENHLLISIAAGVTLAMAGRVTAEVGMAARWTLAIFVSFDTCRRLAPGRRGALLAVVKFMPLEEATMQETSCPFPAVPGEVGFSSKKPTQV